MEAVATQNLDLAFETRCNKRIACKVKGMGHKTYRCISCGQRYGADWVAYWGLVCDVECEGELIAVSPCKSVDQFIYR